MCFRLFFTYFREELNEKIEGRGLSQEVPIGSCSIKYIFSSLISLPVISFPCIFVTVSAIKFVNMAAEITKMFN